MRCQKIILSLHIVSLNHELQSQSYFDYCCIPSVCTFAYVFAYSISNMSCCFQWKSLKYICWMNQEGMLYLQVVIKNSHFKLEYNQISNDQPRKPGLFFKTILCILCIYVTDWLCKCVFRLLTVANCANCANCHKSLINTHPLEH